LGRKREERECQGWARVRGRGGGVGLGPNWRDKREGNREKRKRGGSVPSHVSHPGKVRERKRDRERQ
jgi:hypothetical protein